MTEAQAEFRRNLMAVYDQPERQIFTKFIREAVARGDPSYLEWRDRFRPVLAELIEQDQRDDEARELRLERERKARVIHDAKHGRYSLSIKAAEETVGRLKRDLAAAEEALVAIEAVEDDLPPNLPHDQTPDALRARVEALRTAVAAMTTGEQEESA